MIWRLIFTCFIGYIAHNQKKSTTDPIMQKIMNNNNTTSYDKWQQIETILKEKPIHPNIVLEDWI